MLFFVDQISDKPDWTRKVRDEAIVAKWKQEARDMDWSKVIEGGDMSDQMLAYVCLLEVLRSGTDVLQCIEELRYKADLYEKTGIIPILDATSCVLKSDNIIPDELKAELRRAVAPLEDIPESQKTGIQGLMVQCLTWYILRSSRSYTNARESCRTPRRISMIVSTR